MAARSVGDSIERLALQRVLDHIHAAKRKGVSHFPLSELAEATGLDPTTAEAAMCRLEETGPYTVDRQDLEYSERQWHVRGDATDLDVVETDGWTVRT